MTETLSFPGLGLELEIGRVAFTVFGHPIYWYGILIALAFLLGAAYILNRVKEFGLDADRMMDVILGSVILGIVGARLYYVAFSWDTYRDNLLSVFNIRLGGIAIYGGIIGAVLAAVFLCRWRRVRLLPALDAAVGGLFIGQAIGRWGNFVNIEAFGSNTTLPWGMTSRSIESYLSRNQAALQAIGVQVDPAVPVHPTFFYESMWCLLGFLFVLWYTKRRRFDGELSLIYLGWYGLGRFFIEGLRTDSLLVGTIRISQIVALLCVLASLVTLAVIHSRIRRESDPGYLPLYVNTDEGKAVVAGEFYKKEEEKAAAQGKEDEAGSGADASEPAAETGTPSGQATGEQHSMGEETLPEDGLSLETEGADDEEGTDGKDH